MLWAVLLVVIIILLLCNREKFHPCPDICIGDIPVTNIMNPFKWPYSGTMSSVILYGAHPPPLPPDIIIPREQFGEPSEPAYSWSIPRGLDGGSRAGEHGPIATRSSALDTTGLVSTCSIPRELRVRTCEQFIDPRFSTSMFDKSKKQELLVDPRFSSSLFDKMSIAAASVTDRESLQIEPVCTPSRMKKCIHYAGCTCPNCLSYVSPLTVQNQVLNERWMKYDLACRSVCCNKRFTDPMHRCKPARLCAGKVRPFCEGAHPTWIDKTPQQIPMYHQGTPDHEPYVGYGEL